MDSMMAGFAAFNERWLADQAAVLAEQAVPCIYCNQPRTRNPIHFQGMVIMLGKPEPCQCAEAVAALGALKQAEQAEKMAVARKGAGLVGRLANATFESYERNKPDQKRQAIAVESYATLLLTGCLGDQPWALLHGGYGTGKSHLAAAVIQAALSKGWQRCYFRSWTAHLARMRRSFNKNAKEPSYVVERDLTRARLLVLDDLDKARPTEWSKELLFTALEHRYVHGLATILTVNCKLADLGAWTGPALLDRTIHLCHTVEFKGDSYRSGLALPVPEVG